MRMPASSRPTTPLDWSDVIATSDPSIHDSPHVGGVRLRPYAGPVDHPGMVEVNNAWREAAGFLELVNLDSMAVQYANLSNCDPTTDCVVAERGRSIVAYARVEWADARDGQRTHRATVIVTPDPDRPTLLDILLGWAEARSAAVAAGHDTDRPRILDAFAPATDLELVAACERRGYAAVRFAYEMVRPELDAIPDASMPAGLETRPVRSEQLRLIWEASNEAFRDHFGSVDDSEEAWERFRAEPTNDLSLWRVAWDGDHVAGQVRSYVDTKANERMGRLIGWTENISVRRPWRGRGLARALLAESLRAVRDRGMTEAALGVDAQNEHGALRLYESLGFVVDRTYILFHRPMPGHGDIASSEPDR